MWSQMNRQKLYFILTKTQTDPYIAKKNILVQIGRHGDRTIQSENFIHNIWWYFCRNGFYMVNI